MKKSLFIIFLYSATYGYSQSRMDSLTNSSLFLDDTTGKALAEFATKSPSMKLASNIAEASRYEWKVTGAAWLNNLRASFN